MGQFVRIENDGRSAVAKVGRSLLRPYSVKNSGELMQNRGKRSGCNQIRNRNNLRRERPILNDFAGPSTHRVVRFPCQLASLQRGEEINRLASAQQLNRDGMAKIR